MAQGQTYVLAEALQKLGQIQIAMAVAEALSMKVPNMVLERVFLTERPKAERRNLLRHGRNHRKSETAARQMIFDTALSEIHMTDQPEPVDQSDIFDCFSLGAHAIQLRAWTEMRGSFLIEEV